MLLSLLGGAGSPDRWAHAIRTGLAHARRLSQQDISRLGHIRADLTQLSEKIGRKNLLLSSGEVREPTETTLRRYYSQYLRILEKSGISEIQPESAHGVPETVEGLRAMMRLSGERCTAQIGILSERRVAVGKLFQKLPRLPEKANKAAIPEDISSEVRDAIL